MNAPIIEKFGTAAITLVPVEQVPAVVALLGQAACWAAQRGSAGWTTEELDPTAYEALALRKELFGWTDAGELIACMVLQDSDQLHWPDDQPGDALYIHKLAVRRSHAGRNVGRSLVAFAKRVAQLRRIPFLRLDTVPDTPLVDYFHRCGFVVDQTGPAFYASRWLVRMEWSIGREPSRGANSPREE